MASMSEPPRPPEVPPTLAAPPPAFQPPGGGAPPRVIGRYTVVREVARGGMGVVLLAWDPHLRVQRAIKVLQAEGFSGHDATERFLREARLLARLAHPNIIAVLEAGYDGPNPYLVLPFVEGGSLAGLLQARGGELPVREAVELVDRVARAIDFAHGEGVVHRDLKPANVLLDKAGAPLVTDFGVARDQGSQERLTQAGQVVGTPAYMPPEQAAGEHERVGPRSDVYSLGAILYELLAGRPPFVGSSAINLLKAILTDAPPPLRSLRPEVPPDLEAVVAQAMAKEPEERYDSAAALAADLRRFLQDLPVAARSLSSGARLLRRARRHYVASGLLALALLLTAGGAGLAGVDEWQADRRREARALVLRADEARREGRVDEAAPLLALAAAQDPGSVPAREGLVELALARGDLDGATRALGDLLAVAGAAEPAALRLAGRVDEAHGRDEAALVAYREVLRLDPRDDVTRLQAARLLARRGQHAEAEATLEDLATTEAVRVRATCLAARGASRSAEEAWWAVLRDDVDAQDALGAIVAARLANDDVAGLARLWEEVHRRLADDPRVPSLQTLSTGDLAAVQADLGAATTTRRVRAALAAPVFQRAELLAGVGALAANDPSAVVREAAWASLLAVERATFEAFVERARTLEAPADAAAALTLLERGPRLTASDEGPLVQLASARSPLLRAALALALASGATRHDGVTLARALDLLERLGRDEQADVRGRAVVARAALRAYRGDPDPQGVALALALAAELDRAPEEVVATRARLAAALDQALSASPTAPLLVARATLALERWRVDDARRDVTRALELAPGDAPALELQHLLSRLAGRDAEGAAALERLRARDPAAADEATRRAAWAEEHDAIVLPAPNGAARLVVVPRARGPFTTRAATQPAGVDAAFFVLTSFRRFEPDALLTDGVTHYRGRFALSEVHAVDVDVTQGVGAQWQGGIALQRAASGRDGRSFAITTLDGHAVLLATDNVIGTKAPKATPPVVGASVVVRRTGVEARTRVGAGPAPRDVRVAAEPLTPRRGRAQGGVDLEVGWAPGPHRLTRFVVEGRFEASSPYPPLPERRALEPASPGHPLVAHRVLGSVVPEGLATLDDLVRRGLRLPMGPGGAMFVAGNDDAPIVHVGGLQGDVLVRAKVTFFGRNDQTAGLMLRCSNREDRVHLGVGGPNLPWEPDATGMVSLATQRERDWETPVPFRAFPGGVPVVLELERRGSWVVASFGPSVDRLERLVALYYPLDGPIDACLLARSYNHTEAVLVPFEDVELLVEPPLRAGKASGR
jgi:tetratricopeptide (TPR) repeat protein